MKEKMLVLVLSNLLPALLKMLTPDMLKGWINAGLDSLESQIIKSETKIDDAALPILATIRLVVNG